MSDNSKIDSIINLYEQLNIALESNGASFDWLIKSCKSQSSLAKLQKQALGIFAMSLNSQKKYANEFVPGGYDVLDEKRRQLKSIKEKKKKKQSPKELLNSYKAQIDSADRFRAVMLRAYAELNSITLDLISLNQQYRHDYEKHREIYHKYLGISLVNGEE